jgi:hypothetical protein
MGVCIENVVRIDLEGESLNVDHDGRADDSLLELDWLAASSPRADLKQRMPRCGIS